MKKTLAGFFVAMLLLPSLTFAQTATTITTLPKRLTPQQISAIEQLIALLEQELAALTGNQATGTPVSPSTTAIDSAVGPDVIINANSLSTTSSHPTITGTANGLTTLGLSISQNGNKFDATGTFNTDQYGNWSVTLNNQIYQPGTYQIDVYSNTNVLIASGTLVVSNSTNTNNSVVINSFTASNSSVNAGQPVTFSWSSNLTAAQTTSPATGGCYIYGIDASNHQFQVNNGVTLPASGSLTYTPSATATYILDCDTQAGEGNPTAESSLSVAVNGQTVAQPTATIDPSSLTASTGGKDAAVVTLTGSATNVSQLDVSLDQADGGAGVQVVTVSNGRWSATFPSVSNTNHSVTLIDADQGVWHADQLDTQTLSVTTPTTTTTIGSYFIQATPTSGAAPLSVFFTGMSNGKHTINFGDGSQSQNVSCAGGSSCYALTTPFQTTHTYTTPGTYTATLTTSELSGAVDTETTTVTVGNSSVVTTGTPSCSIGTTQPSYTVGSGVIFSYSSKNASSAQFIGSNNFGIPTGVTLSANGQQLGSANTAGTSGVTLQVTGSGGTATCSAYADVEQSYNVVP